MRRRSFLRLLGLGLPGLALFGRAARAERARAAIILDAEFRATRMNPEGVVNIETDETRVDPNCTMEVGLYGRSPLEPAMEALRAQNQADRALIELMREVQAQGPAIVDQLDLAKLREHYRRPL